ncbi:uncharacterized protein N7477_001303 [Penicillium maclennaniae]|uniref:uncharacterized protein n=1 Tax=Penicillium maclennaniae TaxID=1343394 RepID=UPI002540982B|nr:uncharacterized protein N7477_001303 [Penicillium maclennaniae]KAJ5681363.1 hypothetical protein N7477_001303 [Penicillium maclennaniae]
MLWQPIDMYSATWSLPEEENNYTWDYSDLFVDVDDALPIPLPDDPWFAQSMSQMFESEATQPTQPHQSGARSIDHEAIRHTRAKQNGERRSSVQFSCANANETSGSCAPASSGDFNVLAQKSSGYPKHNLSHNDGHPNKEQ